MPDTRDAYPYSGQEGEVEKVRKPYSAPRIVRVELKPEEVLTTCRYTSSSMMAANAACRFVDPCY
jgi:hypothetical protein